MKIYQVWEHWQGCADFFARDQRPVDRKGLLRSFKDKEKADEYKEECEEKERNRKDCGSSWFRVEEEKVE